MKEWIDQIRLSPEHYGCKYWKYHISGNVMELVVESPFHLDRLSYRLAVIKIGMVLQALSKIIEQSEQNFLIQSFPTLENLRIVAAIRIQKEEVKPKVKAESENEETSTVEMMCEFAEKYQLEFKKIDRESLPDAYRPKVVRGTSLYALCSTHDNPFTWINIGYWQEFVFQIHQTNKKVQKPIIITEKPMNAKLHCGKNHLHALVALTG